MLVRCDMIDHVSIPVRDLARRAAFYARVLAPLGYTQLVERPGTVGFGKKYPEFWLNLRRVSTQVRPIPVPTSLCALRAKMLCAPFMRPLLELGGVSDGDPGPRAAAMTTYFGAFILDPDGNKIEAVSFPARQP